MDDQQFCLKWNNHQSTLISVFDSMLQRNLLVDCTLAAEGRTVKAHKVVLSACSPYFENVLTDHFDKHPIVILKDVKYQELEAMMDYMYRGEVNVSQDQLGSLLKTAESLQIKGLSDSRKEDEPPKKREHPTITRDRTPDKQSAQSRIPLVETHDVETNNMSREGSQSPGPRKRKRLRRRPSQEDLDSKVLVLDNHDGTSNASSTLSNVNTTAVPTTSVPENDTSSRVSSISANASSKPVVRSSVPQVPVINESLEPHSEVMLEPKSEYVEDDTNDDNIEDLTVSLDDDDDDMDQSKPGPSHGDGSNQGFGSWHMDPSQDESFMSTQDPSGQRDAQDVSLTANKEMKEAFNEKFMVIVENSNGRSDYYTSERYNQIINEVQEAKRLKNNNMPISSKQYRRLKRYDIVIDGDQNRLIQKTPQNAKQIDGFRFFCKTDHMFDIIDRVHIAVGHKKLRVMESVLKKTYCNVTRTAIELYLSLCEQCQSKKTKRK